MWRVGIVFVAACAGQSSAVELAPSDTFDINIVVQPQGVTVYAVATDRQSCEANDVFPLVDGPCAPIDDITSCGTAEPGCPTKTVSIDNGAAADYQPGFPSDLTLDVAATPDAVVVIEGCGGIARIPIGSGSFPSPTATMVVDPKQNLDQDELVRRSIGDERAGDVQQRRVRLHVSHRVAELHVPS